jgi:hypothetical protein
LNAPFSAALTGEHFASSLLGEGIGGRPSTTTGIFYKHGDEGESESTQFDYKSATAILYNRVRNPTADQLSPSSPMMLVVSWMTSRLYKPKDDFEEYMDFLGHRYSRLHDKNIVYDNHSSRSSPSLSVVDNKTVQRTPVIKRLEFICRLCSKQQQVVERVRDAFVSMIKANLLLASQSALPVTLAVAVILLYRPMCAVAAAATATSHQ